MRLAIALGAVCALVLPVTPAAAAKGCPAANTIPTSENIDVLVDATLCLLNKERTVRGRKALRHHAVLRRSARSYAKKMVRQRFFSHVAPNGDDLVDRIKRTSYLRGASDWKLGENIAWGSRDQSTPASTVRNWMRSPAHRANLLNRAFTEIGVGVAFGNPVKGRHRESATYSTNFGKRK